MKKKRYKIVAICQIYNEIEKGNLERFVKHIKSLCDALIVYDDGSTDGSYEYMRTVTPYVIRGAKNNFSEERKHKQLLLDKALALNPDFIFYLDADEVLSAHAKERLQEIAQLCIDNDLDGLQFHKINLWRSATWQRVDSLFNIGWFTHFWRVKKGMRYADIKSGLHQSPEPSTVKKIEKTDAISVLHYGFSNEKNLAYKYLTYKSHGQRGYDNLDRLISEEQLEVQKVEKEIFPSDLYIAKEKQPEKKSFIESLTYVETYKAQVFRPKYSIVCLIYKSVEWLKFVYEQVLKYTDMHDKEFFFVANDATEDVLDYLKEHHIPHYIWNNSEKQKEEWYINNVYRAWNYGAKMAQGDFIIFINSDMAFSEGWLDRLIETYDGNNCIASRLVESGKLKSGLYGIEKNFGRSIETYRETEFQKYAATLIANKPQALKPAGLFMPLLIRRSHFLSVGGYPEGNVIPGSNILKPKFAKQGDTCVSGDIILMEKLKTKGITHQTTFDSIVYHFQEGEMDSSKRGQRGQKRQTKQISVMDVGLYDKLGKKIGGISGEIGADTKIIIQKGNVALMDTNRFTIVFIGGKDGQVKKKTLIDANNIVVDSIETAAKYRDYETTVIPFTKNFTAKWETVIEQAFQHIRIHTIRNMPYPTRKVSKIHVIREYVDILKKKSLSFARRVKHKLVLP